MQTSNVLTKISHDNISAETSYVTVPPEVEGCRRVMLETEPLADKTHTALGP